MLKKARSVVAICFWEDKDITGNILILDLGDSGSFVIAKYNQLKAFEIVLISQLLFYLKSERLKFI